MKCTKERAPTRAGAARCDPPDDVFESMELVFDGTLHDAETTECKQAPLQAARDAAEALRSKYAP